MQDESLINVRVLCCSPLYAFCTFWQECVAIKLVASFQICVCARVSGCVLFQFLVWIKDFPTQLKKYIALGQKCVTHLCSWFEQHKDTHMCMRPWYIGFIFNSWLQLPLVSVPKRNKKPTEGTSFKIGFSLTYYFYRSGLRQMSIFLLQTPHYLPNNWSCEIKGHWHQVGHSQCNHFCPLRFLKYYVNVDCGKDPSI